MSSSCQSIWHSPFDRICRVEFDRIRARLIVSSPFGGLRIARALLPANQAGGGFSELSPFLFATIEALRR